MDPVDTTPKPSDMPGAAPAETPSTPVFQAPTVPETPAPATQSVPPAPVAGETESEWKQRAKLWEARAKENFEKAKKFDEEQAAKRTKEENDALALAEKDRELAQLRAERDRERIARETGVPPELLVGNTEAEMREAAAVALEWNNQQAAAKGKPTAAVPASTVTSDGRVETPGQITSRDQLARMSPAERMQAMREGRLTSLGFAPPKTQRRMGNQIEIGARESVVK